MQMDPQKRSTLASDNGLCDAMATITKYALKMQGRTRRPEDREPGQPEKSTEIIWPQIVISNAGAKTYWQTLANNKQQQKQAWPGQQQQQSNGPGPGRQPGRLAGWQRRQHFVNHSIYQIRARGSGPETGRLGDWRGAEWTALGPRPTSWLNCYGQRTYY